MYKNLKKELEYNGYDIDTLGSVTGNNSQTILNKYNGVVPFTLGEVKMIRDQMFPDKTIDYLFMEETDG